MNTRRFIPRLLLCLALGALTTIAIAWSSAALDVPQIGDYLSLDRKSQLPSCQWITMRYRHPGVDRMMWGLLTMSRDSAHFRDESVTPPIPPLAEAIASTRKAGHFPRWWGAEPDFSSYAGDPLSIGVIQDARGWPIVALWWEWIPQTSTSDPVRGGIGLSPGSHPSNPLRALPYRPIPLGLLADTLIFALAWALLFNAPRAGRAVRERFRHRRNQCPRCAYSRAGLDPTTPCPECGQPPRA